MSAPSHIFVVLFSALVLFARGTALASSIFPILAVGDKDLVYVPVYDSTTTSPARLIAYPVVYGAELRPIPLDLEAKTQPLSKETTALSSCRIGNIYRAPAGTDFDLKTVLVVFDDSLKITAWMNKNEPTFEVADSKDSFRVLKVFGSQGLNYILQSMQNGSCMRNVQFYDYLGKTRLSSVEEWWKAECATDVFTCRP